MSEIIRISEQGKRQLIRLKRTTKIDQWNILCRWALCTSIKDQSPLRSVDLGPMSNVEMTWETFCGPFQVCFYALLIRRLHDIPEEQALFDGTTSLCTSHVHRGITAMSHKKPRLETVLNITD
jgi:DNA sulfur modification protein DndE